MKLDDVARAGAGVKAVDVLRDDERVAQFRDRFVCRIRLRAPHDFSPHLVPLPHELRVAGECLRRRKIFGSKVSPEATVAAKGGDPAVGGNPGAGEDDDRARLRFADRRDRRFRDR